MVARLIITKVNKWNDGWNIFYIIVNEDRIHKKYLIWNVLKREEWLW